MEKIISETDSEIEKLKDQAQHFIDEYWSVFKMHNRNYMNSGDLSKLGSIAPRIRKDNSSGRYRVIWSKFKKTKANSKQKGWADKDITPTQRGYRIGTFRKEKATPWELELIEHYEASLSPIRRKIEVLSDYRNAINLLIRKDSKNGTSN